jgi:nucleotide-binding universal stress UspA family protein
MFRNILISVDGSPHSEEALREAIDIAAAGNGRLTILTAIPKPANWTTTAATAALVQSLSDDLEHEFTEVSRAAESRVPATIPVTTIVTHEPIRVALMQQIETGKYDLLVMGSRGRGALSASLLGSASHYALNHSKIPVLIVHADEEATATTPEQPAAMASSV